MTSKQFRSQQAKQFKFWLDQRVQDGMQYQYALFQRIGTLSYEQRHQLHQQASHFAKNGADILVTYEGETCHLWLNLKHRKILEIASNVTDKH